MSLPEFVKIARCQSGADAQHAKAVLVWNGIDAQVNGESLIANLGGMGTALGGVDLHVPREDAERAVSVLEEYRRHEPGSRPGPWFCGTCEEEVDEGFGLCWSCCESREVVEAEFPALADLAMEPVGKDTSDPANAALPLRTSAEEANPYAPPIVEEMVDVVAKDKSADQEAAERFITYASNAAVFGLFVPVLGTLYSVFLLYEAMRLSWSYSSEYRRLIVRTLLLDCAAALEWTFFLTVFSTAT